VAWRPPKRIFLVTQWVEIRQVTREEMRDVVADQDGAMGAWDSDTNTIYLMRQLSSAQKARAFAHELQHALIDLMDP
jgi:Zn-dependent peptidase ImmA (M78 family)